jgi:acetyltransferase
LAYHAWLYTQPRPGAGNVAGVGDAIAHELRLGLILFFVLSGFLLFQPWVRSGLSDIAGPSLRSFVTRRAARILPAYYVALLGAIVLLWGHDALPGVRLPPASDLWLFAVFGQNFKDTTLLKLDPPMWTLAVEVMFYAALPALGWAALRLRGSLRAQLAVPLGFLALGVAYNWLLSRRPDVPDTLIRTLPAMAPYFALGMLAAVAAHGRVLGRRAVAVALLLGAAAVVADGWWAAAAAEHGSRGAALRIWRDDLAAAGFAVVILAVACARSPLRALQARPMVWLGQVSYGIYLWHVPILLALKINGLLPESPVWGAAVALAPTLLVAAASWYWVERPLVALAHRPLRVQRRAGAGGSRYARA